MLFRFVWSKATRGICYTFLSRKRERNEWHRSMTSERERDRAAVRKMRSIGGASWRLGWARPQSAPEGAADRTLPSPLQTQTSECLVLLMIGLVAYFGNLKLPTAFIAAVGIFAKLCAVFFTTLCEIRHKFRILFQTRQPHFRLIARHRQSYGIQLKAL